MCARVGPSAKTGVHPAASFLVRVVLVDIFVCKLPFGFKFVIALNAGETGARISRGSLFLENVNNT